jgi:hypothetical protein
VDVVEDVELVEVLLEVVVVVGTETGIPTIASKSSQHPLTPE